MYPTDISGPTSREKKRRRNHFELGDSIHEAEYGRIKRPVDRGTKEPIEPAHRFGVTLEPDECTDEKSVPYAMPSKKAPANIEFRYALFANYQKVVHREKPSQISKSGFRSFLCSGLRRSVEVKNGKWQNLGSYHQCYRLDGRLVAIGVLDLLPDCVSSVYLMYVFLYTCWVDIVY